MTRLTHTIPQAIELTNICRSLIYQQIKLGNLRVTKLGKKTLVTDEALREWVAGLEATTQKNRAESEARAAVQP